MNATIRNFIARNSVFAWIALGTGLVLLVPLVAMRFTDAVAWSAMDFVVMGALLAGMASLFVLVARKGPGRLLLPIGGLFLLGFLYLWAELAVGIFTGLGS